MAAGFILLAGGGSDDPQVFNYAMFDFRRLVAAPIVIVAGIVVEVVAIMRRPKEKRRSRRWIGGRRFSWASSRA